MQESEKLEYKLLETWAKRYHALIHSSGDATADCDEEGSGKWTGSPGHHVPMKNMILWAHSLAYVFDDRDYDPTFPGTVFRWPKPEARARVLTRTFANWNDYYHVGDVPKKAKKIMYCNAEAIGGE